MGAFKGFPTKRRGAPGEQFPGLGKNQAEMFCRELLQQLFQGVEADRRLMAFVKQDDSTGNN